jgi:hypothetical protein
MSHQIKYRTFDQLLEDVTVDLSTFALEGMIEPQQLIKVAMRVNFDLGLRVQPEAHDILEIEHGKVKLPSNFYSLNYANICGTYRVEYDAPSGSHIEDVIIAPTEDCVQTEETSCQPERTCVNDCGEYYQLVQKVKTEVRIYETFFPLKVKANQSVSGCCPNVNYRSPNEIEIRDGFVYSSFSSGKIYINYQSAMEDVDGTLLVMDHPLVNEYYEYAIKQRIMENLFFAGEPVTNQMQLIEGRLRAARNNALSFVNTPNFAELQKIWEMNRRSMYDKYINMFKSVPTYR